MHAVRAPAKSHRELIVWQKALLLTQCAYRIAAILPRSEQFGMASQIRRAAMSVQSNIAEGWGRGGSAELHRFLTIARGSLYELDNLFDAAEALQLAPRDTL